MTRVVAIGEHRFETIRRQRYFYVDKTDFLGAWWRESGAAVTVITRPRLFGKTLFLDTVRHFFSDEFTDQAALFDGLTVWEDAGLRAEAGRHPVLSLTWSGISDADFEDCCAHIAASLRALCAKHQWRWESTAVDGTLRREIQAFMDGAEGENSVVTVLRSLCQAIHQQSGVKPLILLDEYDTPLKDAWRRGDGSSVAQFFHQFMIATFKDNPSLGRALVAGITDVRDGSMLAGFNHWQVVTTSTPRFETACGFTEPEVRAALDEYGLAAETPGVKAWYGGYVFGRQSSIYNPWAVTNFLFARTVGGYWAQASSNAFAGDLIRAGSAELKQDFAELLSGGEIWVRMRESVSLRPPFSSSDVWALMVARGCLKVVSRRERDLCELAIVNRDVRQAMAALVRCWFDGRGSGAFKGFLNALTFHEAEGMSFELSRFAAERFSDFGASERDPAPLVCGVVLGLQMLLSGRFTVKRRKKDGQGGCGVMLLPLWPEKDDGFLLEFRARTPASEVTLETMAQTAWEEISDSGVEADLVALGLPAERIRKYVLAFEGKRVLVAG